MIRADGRTWITATEAPDWLHIQPGTVRAWARDDRVAGHRIGREVYYDLAELTEVEYLTRNAGTGRKRSPVLAGPTGVHS